MEKVLNLFQRMNQVMKEVQTVHKGTTVKITEYKSYTAVSHDDVTGLLHAPLTRAGIIAAASMDSCELDSVEIVKEYQGKQSKSIQYMVKVWASVTFINIDDPIDRINLKSFAYALDNGDKAVGKAYSMAVKYIYLKGFMLESLDEEESRDNERYNAPQVNYSTNGHQRQNQPRPEQAYTAPVNRSSNQASSGQQQSLPSGNAAATRASEKQLSALAKMGVKFNNDITMKQASELIASSLKG